MAPDIFENVSLRRKRIAGLLLSEKSLQKKDLVALNLELYAASQAVSSAQRQLISDHIQQIKMDIRLGRKQIAMKHLSAIEKLIQQL